MPCLQNKISILDSSSASRLFSFSSCFVLCSISRVPLKAEINQESRCAQDEGDEALLEDGEGDELDGGGVDVAIKPQQGRNGIKKSSERTGQ
jgi:hypothetical protein